MNDVGIKIIKWCQREINEDDVGASAFQILSTNKKLRNKALFPRSMVLTSIRNFNQFTTCLVATNKFIDPFDKSR